MAEKPQKDLPEEPVIRLATQDLSELEVHALPTSAATNAPTSPGDAPRPPRPSAPHWLFPGVVGAFLGSAFTLLVVQLT